MTIPTLDSLENRTRLLFERALQLNAVPDGTLAILLDLLVHLRTRGDDSERSLRERLQMSQDREAKLKLELAGATMRADNERAAATLLKRERDVLLERELAAKRGERDAVCPTCGAALACAACSSPKHPVPAGGEA